MIAAAVAFAYVLIAIAYKRAHLRVYPLSKEGAFIGTFWPAFFAWKMGECVIWLIGRICRALEWIVFESWRSAK